MMSSTYTVNIGTLKHIKQVLTNSKGEMDINIIIVGDFCILLSAMGRSSRQNINISHTLGHIDLRNV